MFKPAHADAVFAQNKVYIMILLEGKSVRLSKQVTGFSKVHCLNFCKVKEKLFNISQSYVLVVYNCIERTLKDPWRTFY